MNIFSLDSVRNFFSQVVDDIKSRRPLTPMEKKVGIVALVVIAWITAIYLLHRWHRAEEMAAIKQKLGKHNKANNDDVKVDGESQTDSKTSKLTKRLPESLNPSKQTESSKVIEISEPKFPAVNQKTTFRAIHHGFFDSNGKKSHELDLPQLLNLKDKFKSYCAEAEIQQDYFKNDNEDLVYLNYDKFGKNLGISWSQLVVFIRYLVLSGEIYSYSYSKNGFCLYLTPDAKESDTVPLKGKHFGQKELLEIDQYMVEQEQKMPSVESFPADEIVIAEKILLAIQSAHYSRLSANSVYAPAISDSKIKCYDEKVKSVLDKLVNQGVIHSWNSVGYNSSIIMRIEESDPLGAGYINSKEWRDKAKIQKEKHFIENNQVDREAWLSLTFLDAFPEYVVYSDHEKETFKNLIDGLNQRTEPGPFEWHAKMCGSGILKVLKDEGLIHSFERIGFSSVYKVYLKEIDYLAAK